MGAKPSTGTRRAKRADHNDIRSIVKLVAEFNSKAELIPCPKTHKVLCCTMSAFKRNTAPQSRENCGPDPAGQISVVSSKNDVKSGRLSKRSLEKKRETYWRVHICPKKHFMRKAKGLPFQYAGSHSWVFCDVCGSKGIDKHKSFWHCNRCRYDTCMSCGEDADLRVVVKAVDRKSAPKMKKTSDVSRILRPSEFSELYQEFKRGCEVLSSKVTESILEEFNSKSEGKNRSGGIDSGVNGQKQCEICFDAPETVMLSCTHSFCEECIADWTRVHGTCPMCRSEISREGGEQSLGWILANQDRDLVKVGGDVLRRTWKIVNSYPLVRKDVSLDCVLSLSETNVQEHTFCRRQRLESLFAVR